MAPQVKKAKTAFLYYQGDQLSAIRKELGLSMGDAMTEVRNTLQHLIWLPFMLVDDFHYNWGMTLITPICLPLDLS